jgi:pSer/pThr/pTyr-binding forkhead associated (FHA) protein
MQASLVMFKPDGTRRDFPLREGSVVVGRKTSCELRIPLSSVSRQHCELSIEGDAIKLKDLGSSNGTYHNAVRVQEAELTAGDEVVIGPVVFTVVVNGVPDEIKPVRTVVDSSETSDPAASADPVQQSSEPEILTDPETGDLVDQPGPIEEEISTPTIDLDDPIAALEALANEEDDGEMGDESSVIEFDFEDLGEEDLKSV